MSGIFGGLRKGLESIGSFGRKVLAPVLTFGQKAKSIVDSPAGQSIVKGFKQLFPQASGIIDTVGDVLNTALDVGKKGQKISQDVEREGISGLERVQKVVKPR